MKRPLLPVFSLFLIGASACDGYTRTNPLDPEYPLQLTIVGPDTIYSVQDTVTYEVATDPPHAGLAFVWGTSDASRLALVPQTPGKVASLANGRVNLTVNYGTHQAQKEVVVEQRAVRLQIAAVPSTEMQSLGQVLQLNAAVVDARGTPVQGSFEVLTWTSSDSAVASVSGGQVTALKDGTVWIKAAALDQADSVQVRVRQVPVTLQFGGPEYTINLPGGSVQTEIVARDARGNPLQNPAGLTLSSSRSSFQVNSNGLVQSSGYGSTTITARLGELTAMTLVRVVGGTQPSVTGVSAGLLGLEVPNSSFNFLFVELDTRDAELDLDAATIEVYSTEQTWMTTRVIPLQQGVANFSTVFSLYPLPGAGEVWVRLRDAATNQSDLSVWDVTTQPHLGSPEVSIEQFSQTGNTINVTVLLTRGDEDLRNVHVVGLTAGGEVVLISSRPVSNGGQDEVQMSIAATLPSGMQLTFIGVLASDVEGNFSLVRNVSPVQ